MNRNAKLPQDVVKDVCTALKAVQKSIDKWGLSHLAEWNERHHQTFDQVDSVLGLLTQRAIDSANDVKNMTTAEREEYMRDKAEHEKLIEEIARECSGSDVPSLYG
jgi:hypothetical protein